MSYPFPVEIPVSSFNDWASAPNAADWYAEKGSAPIWVAGERAYSNGSVWVRERYSSVSAIPNEPGVYQVGNDLYSSDGFSVKSINTNTNKASLPNIYPKDSTFTITVQNPYQTGDKSITHSQLLYSANKFGGYSWWLCATPFNSGDSSLENPCIYASNDLLTWVIPHGSNPVYTPIAGYFNADTSIAFDETGSKLYLIFRERNSVANNYLRVMHTVDGKTWTAPQTIKTGTGGSQDYACPSLWWNPVISKWQAITINLDAVDPNPIQLLTSSTSDIYGGWGNPVTLTISPPSGAGFTFWHGHTVRDSSGTLFSVWTERANNTGGGDVQWYLYSSIDGQNFTLEGVRFQTIAYRPSIFFDQNGSAKFLTCEVDKTIFNIIDCYSKSEWDELAVKRAGNLSGSEFSIIRDTFSRPDSATSPGNSDNGLTWALNTANAAGISSNQLYNSANGVRCSIGTLANNGFAELVVGAGGIGSGGSPYIGHLIRMASAGAGNYIRVGWDFTVSISDIILQVYDGAFSIVQQVTIGNILPVVTGRILGVKFVENKISIYVDRCLIGVVTCDYFLTQARHGIQLSGTTTRSYVDSYILIQHTQI